MLCPIQFLLAQATLVTFLASNLSHRQWLGAVSLVVVIAVFYIQCEIYDFTQTSDSKPGAPILDQTQRLYQLVLNVIGG